MRANAMPLCVDVRSFTAALETPLWWTSPSDPGSVQTPPAAPPRGIPPWMLLRLVGAAFPPDGFAEATQLEEAHRGGLVRNAVDLAAFVGEALWEVGSLTLPFVRAAQMDPAVHAAADGRCDAALRDPRARRASADKGQAFLNGAAPLSRAISQLVLDARRRHLAGHLAPAFGAVAGLLGAEDDDACRLFLFLGARGIVSAAVRLGVLGPPAGHAVLSAATPTVNALIQHCRGDGAVCRPPPGGPPDRRACRSASTPARPTPAPLARISLRPVPARHLRVSSGGAPGAPRADPGPGATPPRRAPAGAEAPRPPPPAARAPPRAAGTPPAAPRSTA